MPANFQRLLPFALIAIVLLFVLPAVLKKHTSGTSAGTKSSETVQATNLIDQGEVVYQAANGHYTQHIADLVSAKPGLAAALAVGVTVQLDVGSDGQSYLAQVGTDVISLVRARKGAKVTAQSCLVLKSGSGVNCPVTSAPAKK